jgi:hypothetical protein
MPARAPRMRGDSFRGIRTHPRYRSSILERASALLGAGSAETAPAGAGMAYS